MKGGIVWCFPLEHFFEINPDILGSGIDTSRLLIMGVWVVRETPETYGV